MSRAKNRRDGSGAGSRRIRVARTAGGVWVGWPGGAKLFTPERPGTAAGNADGDAAAEVRAPMTARVVKVAARAGADVRADEVLVILQAMKMEYRLTSPRAGRVEAIHCAEGEMVDLGRTLVTLAPAQDDGGGPSRS
jgi:3-methylcrotonyl-CoA carboxylase alpha subunit